MSPEACLPSSKMNLLDAAGMLVMTGLLRKCFYRDSTPRGRTGCLSGLLHPCHFWSFMTTVTLNLQFGVLAAIRWFLADQDLKSLKLIEDLVSPDLEFIL